MGLDVSALVVFGLAVERRETTNTVRKFDEDTGAPYMKEVKGTALFVHGTGIKLCDHDEHGDWMEGLPTGIVLVHHDHNAYHGWVLGWQLTETGSHRSSDASGISSFRPLSEDQQRHITGKLEEVLGHARVPSPEHFVISRVGY